MSHIKQPKWSIPTQNQMPVLMLQNSLTRKKEPLITKDKSLTWYSCGPTVYDKSHLGHARNYIAFDIQRRILEKYFGYNVTFVMNITDVDDKIILNARREFLLKNYLKTADNLRETCQKAWDYYCEKYFKLTSPWPEFVEKVNAGSVTSDDVKFSLYFKTALNARKALEENEEDTVLISKMTDILSIWLDKQHGHTVSDPKIFKEFTKKWEADFFQDMDSLNVRKPDILTRVSEFVPEIAAYVDQIIQNGFAYEREGSVYFDVVKFNQDPRHDYAKLEPWSASNIKLLAEGEGELADSSGKKNPADFVLWKRSKSGEPMWDSKWGKGRPGWHIECSVMASSILGDNMDIHSGGIDLAFPHHDNELAQAEAYYNCPQWVNYFLHCGHLHIEGMKMSKSLKNFLSIKEGLETATAAQMRIMFLLHQWDSTLDFSKGSIGEAKSLEKTVENFFLTVNALKREKEPDEHNFGELDKDLLRNLNSAQEQIHEALCDSFNTPKVMLEMRKLITQSNQYYSEKKTANVYVLSKVASYISDLLLMFGVFADKNNELGQFSQAKSSVSSEQDLAYITKLSEFRDQVRSLGKEQNNAELLKVCDKLRDDVRSLGVLLEDREGKPAIVKLVNKEQLLKQEEEIKQRETEKRLEKERRQQEIQQKEEERRKKAMIDPMKMFKTEEYLEWDETGIPLKNSDGSQVAKSKRKKLEKQHQAQTKLYQEYKSSS